MSKHNLSTEDQRPTHTVEDYLMTMHVMERDFGEIVAARLAEMLGVAPATVAMTFRRMERDNWITGKGRKSVHLTETGRHAAHSVTRRHMLTEWLLLKILKVDLSLIHDEAHGIEHALSPHLEERLRDILGDPHVCPHGNPFPGYETEVSGWVPLTELTPGENVVIRRVHEFAEENPELLNFLIRNRALPGTEVKVLESLLFNQTLTIETGDRQVTFGFPTARYIFAERVNPG
jgi:DtxR family transcriptional regulator, Mn-dependent transcriptional regulator